MKHEDYTEMLALAALDVLDEGERRTLAAHLAECADCRVEINALRDAAASLVYAASPVAPVAPELRERILARLKSQPQARLREPSNGGAAMSSDFDNVRSLDEFATRREARTGALSRRVAMFGALAASIAVAALLISLVIIWQRNNRLQNELARLGDTVNQTEQQLARTEQELARTRADRELLAAPEAQTATLAGTKLSERARARLTFDERTGRALLVAANLPPAPAGFAYQLWFIAEGRPPLPGNVFTTDQTGHAEMHDIVPPEGRHTAIYAVTLEPASGVSAPTGEVYLKSSTS